MARIAVGISGDSFGHISQALAVAESMPQHQFLFLGGGRVLGLREMGRDVVELPQLGTHYTRNRVAVVRTLWRGGLVLCSLERILARVSEVFGEFKPDLVLTAFEAFTAETARRLGIPCVSLDSHHFLGRCDCDLPRGHHLSRFLYGMSLRRIYSRANRYFVSVFFPLRSIDPATEVFPPVLSPAITRIKPAPGDHVLVYQTSPTFGRLLPALRGIRHGVVVYGLNGGATSGNIEFRPPSRDRFLEDLAGCRYLITNGGHNAMAEALYLGKPVLSFPIGFAYEQLFNAHMLAKLGYGAYSLDGRSGAEVIARFEEHLDEYRARIAQGRFYGNDAVAARLESMIRERGGSPA